MHPHRGSIVFRFASCCAFVFSLAAAPIASAQELPSVAITGSVTLVESPQESGPVQRATKDLQNDFRKVFGQAPKVVNSLLDAGPAAILIAQRDNVPAGVNCATTTDIEAFAFSIASVGGATRVICLTGADMRGTIFAVYQFSQSVLGVDPMYLWTDKQPVKRVAITLPKDFVKTYPSPVF